MESSITLYPHQEEALARIKPGCILHGGVGSGKTFTSLAFYLRNFVDRKLYVITTAKKRNGKDWENEAEAIGVKEVVVDSWNNIKNYAQVQNAFFIFDEQRVVGSGSWSRAFVKIAKANKWMLLSATPGDTWVDYIPTFVANGFYTNKTDFIDQHVEYDRFSKFPKIKKYHNERKLENFRRQILIPMNIKRHTTRKRKYINTDYDKDLYGIVMNSRWNVFTEKPIKNASELTQTLRKIVAINEDRAWAAKFIMDVHDRIIVFYNYNYELDILIDICNQLEKPYSMYNGKLHQEIPDTEDWIYLVQYTSGAEGWNCILTDVIMFYSLNYSYRVMEQAEGRIDRLNTTYSDLEYFNLTSKSKIDSAVRKAIDRKKRFNESAFAKGGRKVF